MPRAPLSFRYAGRSRPARDAGSYVLDFDFFKEDVAVADTLDIVRQLHDLEFSMFRWTLGEKAIEHLGPSDLKEGGP